MKNRPSLSVVMTVYNAGPYLGPAIESVLAQTFRDFEFLIVDDASTDGSAALLEDYARRDPRIRLLTGRVNRGQTACLNEGIGAARAPWIARQDADDLSLPRRFEKQWRVVEAVPDLALVGTNGWVIDGGGRVTGMVHAPLGDSGIRWALPFRNPFVHTSVLFRRPAALRYDERYRICQDWDFWFRLLETGRGVNLPDRLVAYRHVEKSLSHSAGDRTEEECAEIVGRIWRGRFGQDPEHPELLAAFRKGLSPENRGAFWEWYGGLRARFFRGGTGQAVAVHRLQAAGALRPVSAADMLGELAAGFREAPVWTVSTLARTLARPASLNVRRSGAEDPVAGKSHPAERPDSGRLP